MLVEVGGMVGSRFVEVNGGCRRHKNACLGYDHGGWW